MLRRFVYLAALALLFSACTRPAAVFPAGVQAAPARPPATFLPVRPTVTPAAPVILAPAASPVAAQTASAEVTQPPEAGPTETLLPAATPFTPAYTVQPGTPITTTDFLHPEASCAWTGLSGQVFDAAGQPLSGLVIEVVGEYDGEPFSRLGMTGAAAKLGAGGYEVKLSDLPIQDAQTFQAQVMDDGQPLSEPFTFSILPGCENNLVLLNFVAAGEVYADQLYLPRIYRGP